MEVQFLLIGNGLTGTIKTYDYPRDKLRVVEVSVESANSSPIGNPVNIFDVILHPYNGEVYAIGVGGNTDSLHIEQLIDKTGINPIPKSLL